MAGTKPSPVTARENKEEEVVGAGGDSNIKSPIVTMVASAAESAPMSFPLLGLESCLAVSAFDV